MELLHNQLDHFSIQQSPKGRLPAGLLNECETAVRQARSWAAKLGPELPQKIDQAVFSDPDFIPQDLLLEAHHQKLYSQWLPRALGGGGGHPLSMAAFNQELASYCLGITNLIGPHYVASGLVAAAGAFRVLRLMIEDVRKAEMSQGHCIFSAAITEPMAGTDLEETELLAKAKVCTHAQRVPGGFIVQGQKIFISNSAVARWHVITAFEDLQRPSETVMILAIPASSPGVSTGRLERKMGQAASSASVLFLDKVFVPEHLVCLTQDQFSSREEYLKFSKCIVNDVLSLSRAGVGGMAAGALRKTLELVIAATESSSGRAIPQWIQSQIGQITHGYLEAKTLAWEAHLECLSRGPYRHLQNKMIFGLLRSTPLTVLRASLGKWLASDSGREAYRKNRLKDFQWPEEKLISGWGAFAKARCSDLAMHAVLKALETVGVNDRATYEVLEKILRDVKLLQIYEGTNDFCKLISYKNFVGPANQERKIFGD